MWRHRRVLCCVVASWALGVGAGCTPSAKDASIGVSEYPDEVPPKRAVQPAKSTALRERDPPAKPAAATDAARCEAGPKSLPDPHCPRPADWPGSTRSLEVRELVHVLEEPTARARYIGKVTRGTRVAWRRVVAASTAEMEAPSVRRGRKACEYWVNIEPAGFLCSDKLKPAFEAPAGQPQPVVKPGGLVPAAYYAVAEDATPAYAKPEDVQASVVAKELTKKFMVVGGRSVDIDGVPYLSTDYGLVEQAALRRFGPSQFSGIDLRTQPPRAWPFAWLGGARGATPAVYAEPSKKAALVRKAQRREIVQILEERDGFVRVGPAEWIERSQLRVAELAAPPPEVQGTEQWIDVDLDEQVLMAYEGKTPIFATLVSTGRNRHATPPGVYRVRAKAATTPLAGGEKDSPNRYEISGVPWAIRFRNGLFIHTAYWHDAFGNVVSHGCINVSPRDARFLFDWVEPRMPDGWSEIEVRDAVGPVVRVRDRTQPSPAAHDYSDEAPATSARPRSMR